VPVVALSYSYLDIWDLVEDTFNDRSIIINQEKGKGGQQVEKRRKSSQQE